MNPPQTRRSVLLGALVAPLGAPLAFLLYGLSSVLIHEGVAGMKDWPVGLALVTVFGLPIAYAAMLLLGYPYVSWLGRTGRLSWLSVCAGAAVAGGVAFPLSLLILGGGGKGAVSGVMAGAGMGLACGVLFCLVAGPHRFMSTLVRRPS